MVDSIIIDSELLEQIDQLGENPTDLAKEREFLAAEKEKKRLASEEKAIKVFEEMILVVKNTIKDVEIADNILEEKEIKNQKWLKKHPKEQQFVSSLKEAHMEVLGRLQQLQDSLDDSEPKSWLSQDFRDAMIHFYEFSKGVGLYTALTATKLGHNVYTQLELGGSPYASHIINPFMQFPLRMSLLPKSWVEHLGKAQSPYLDEAKDLLRSSQNHSIGLNESQQGLIARPEDIEVLGKATNLASKSYSKKTLKGYFFAKLNKKQESLLGESLKKLKETKEALARKKKSLDRIEKLLRDSEMDTSKKGRLERQQESFTHQMSDLEEEARRLEDESKELVRSKYASSIALMNEQFSKVLKDVVALGDSYYASERGREDLELNGKEKLKKVSELLELYDTLNALKELLIQDSTLASKESKKSFQNLVKALTGSKPSRKKIPNVLSNIQLIIAEYSVIQKHHYTMSHFKKAIDGLIGSASEVISFEEKTLKTYDEKIGETKDIDAFVNISAELTKWTRASHLDRFIKAMAYFDQERGHVISGQLPVSYMSADYQLIASEQLTDLKRETREISEQFMQYSGLFTSRGIDDSDDDEKKETFRAKQALDAFQQLEKSNRTKLFELTETYLETAGFPLSIKQIFGVRMIDTAQFERLLETSQETFRQYLDDLSKQLLALEQVDDSEKMLTDFKTVKDEHVEKLKTLQKFSKALVGLSIEEPSVDSRFRDALLERVSDVENVMEIRGEQLSDFETLQEFLQLEILSKKGHTKKEAFIVQRVDQMSRELADIKASVRKSDHPVQLMEHFDNLVNQVFCLYDYLQFDQDLANQKPMQIRTRGQSIEGSTVMDKVNQLIEKSEMIEKLFQDRSTLDSKSTKTARSGFGQHVVSSSSRTLKKSQKTGFGSGNLMVREKMRQRGLLGDLDDSLVLTIRS